MQHGHNMNDPVDGLVAKNWEQIYNHIIEEAELEGYRR